MRSLSIGATGMLAQQLNVETISNNIANMTTTGYKRQRAEFQDLLYQNQRRVGSTSSDAGTIVPSGIQVGTGVKAAAIYRINEQGNINPTGNTLDLAINGQGYFQIQLPNGETAYTRAGSLQLNAEGTIVTADGYQVMPGIVVPQNTIDITVNPNGEVLAKIDGQIEPQNGGPIRFHQPWKYGFKAGKSIVKITLTDRRPVSFWEQLQASEYGFWANVNPQVAHPRWSQANERVIGSGERVPTQLFNGYADFVASLYTGLQNERLWA